MAERAIEVMRPIVGGARGRSMPSTATVFRFVVRDERTDVLHIEVQGAQGGIVASTPIHDDDLDAYIEALLAAREDMRHGDRPAA